MNRMAAKQYAAGTLSPARAVTLVVVGRRSGQEVRVPVVVADYEGERYLVSMLGNDANWVRNVGAAGGRATLVRDGEESVRLHSVVTSARPPILRRYLELAPGARPHISVRKDAPLEDFEKVAGRFPVFRVESISVE